MPTAFTFGSGLMDEALLTRTNLSSLEALVLLLSKADAIWWVGSCGRADIQPKDRRQASGLASRLFLTFRDPKT